MGSALRVLYLANNWPETNASAAGLRIWSLLDFFQAEGWKIRYGTDARENAFKPKLEARGVEAFCVQPNDPAFDAWVREFAPDLVLFDQYLSEEKWGWRIRAQLPGALRVMDTQDLHFLRLDRQAAFEPAHPPSRSVALSEVALRELASIHRSDLTLIISDSELRLLTENLGVRPELLQLCGLSYASAPAIEKTRPFAERGNFCFIGNFRHAPNLDCVNWMARELWPALRHRLPQAELHVFGAYTPRSVTQLDDPSSGFRVMGQAPDQYETLERYRVLLAPLRFGAGVKGKISDSWWCGTPVLTTPIGAEGMGDSEGDFPRSWGGLILDSAQEAPSRFVELAEELYHSRESWERAREQGRRILGKLFCAERNRETLISRLLGHLADREGHRASNWIGQMLWHHSHQSTLYFSKWIELKRSSHGTSPAF